ncbi:MAG: outer membrane protein assembly factor BamC [Gammaproteobacteria bacterium]
MSFRLRSLTILSLIVFASAFISSCSKISKVIPKFDEVVPDQRKEYKKSESLPDLEVPPDLTTETIDDSLAVPDVDETGSATFSTYQERVAKQKENRLYSDSGDSASIAEISGEQLIVVSGSTSDVWPTLQEFWADLGYDMDLDDQELGVMETDWQGNEESLARDRFKIFIEQADGARTTSVYLSHVGEDFDQGLWVERDRDILLERKMALRIQNTLGGGTSSATDVATTAVDEAAYISDTNTETSDDITAELLSAGDGKMYLAVQSDSITTWSLVGEILSSESDITVENSDQAKQTYDIAYLGEQESKGLMSKLAFWKDDANEFKVSITEVGEKTEVIILNNEGEWDNSATADIILNRIKSSL